MIRSVLIILSAIFSTSAFMAGQYNDVLSIGSPGPAWDKLPGTDGRQHSLTDLKDRDVVVVVFTCNSCPTAIEYEGRLRDFCQTFEKSHPGRVAVVAINVNTIPEDRLDKMKERAEAEKFPYPYLYDETQKIAKAYGATYTPEFFVLNKERKVTYMGAFDDKVNPKEAKIPYLADAVKATLAGQPVATAETVARGCKIRYARVRK